MQFAFGARNGSNDGPQCGAHAAALFLGWFVRHHFHQIVPDIPNLIAVLGYRVCAALVGQYIAATASVYVRGLPKPSCFWEKHVITDWMLLDIYIVVFIFIPLLHWIRVHVVMVCIFPLQWLNPL